ncbi:hypothetical protein TCAP_00751 [Tolypocladium capitatum]|uniref:Transmembrane protein n=1 Tax=Tolypocladium capitatum TaxID=45235 RepID=A0A2K3QP71_9HYPO|nr:hypothetical protein TCAP_00751 [Tolypocladium capitatum]
MLLLFFLPRPMLRRPLVFSGFSGVSPFSLPPATASLFPLSLWKKLKLLLDRDLLRLDRSRMPAIGPELPLLSLFLALSSFAAVFLLSSRTFCSSSCSLLRVRTLLTMSSLRFLSSSFTASLARLSLSFSACFAAFSAVSRSFFSRFLSSLVFASCFIVAVLVSPEVGGITGLGGMAPIGGELGRSGAVLACASFDIASCSEVGGIGCVACRFNGAVSAFSPSSCATFAAWVANMTSSIPSFSCSSLTFSKVVSW